MSKYSQKSYEELQKIVDDIDIMDIEVKKAVEAVQKSNWQMGDTLRYYRIAPVLVDEDQEFDTVYFAYDLNFWRANTHKLNTIQQRIQYLSKDKIHAIFIGTSTTKVQMLLSTYFSDVSFKEQSFTEDVKIDNTTIHKVNALIEDAILRHASDIHLNVKGDQGIIKFRINGELLTFISDRGEEVKKMIRHLMDLSQVVSTDPVAPSSGRFTKYIRGERFDFRFHSIGIYPPETYSVTAVVRILYKDNRSLDDLGFEPEQKERLIDVIQREGIIIFSGPTGSGKTTSMYALLDAARSLIEGKKILSIEDPPEILRDMFEQIEIREARGITWEGALKSCLRLDPDILIIGEIRDSLSAETAIQAAITGHTVLTTIHVDKVEDIPQRFIQLARGQTQTISLSTIAASISALISQRLIKKIYLPEAIKGPIFPYIREKIIQLGYNIGEVHDEYFDLPPEVYYPNPNANDLAKGYYKGYDMSKNGRTVIAEVVRVDDNMRKMIENNADPSEIRKYLRDLEQKTQTYYLDDGTTVINHTHISMIMQAIKKINQGLISIKDVEKYL
ncbi:MAG: ATPase, T2SS/T4P/T4SS family [Conexivisphaerales archaeon]